MKRKTCKVISLTAALLLLLSFSACGKEDEKTNVPSGTLNTIETETETQTGTDISGGVTISEDGEHVITGRVDGQILVTAENATIVLKDAVIENPNGPAILGDDGNGGDVKQNLTVKLEGSSTVTGGVKHGIQGKDNLIITGDGQVDVYAEKDGLHAGNTLTVNSGTVTVRQSYEGAEAPEINITGGTLILYADDDGINAASDDATDTPSVNITGGLVCIYSCSDGIDTNGTIEITGGTVLSFINAPMDGEPIDTERSSAVLPTLFVETGFTPGSVITVEDEDGSVIFSWTAAERATSFSLTMPDLVNGDVYLVYADDDLLDTLTASTVVQGTMGGQMPGGGGGNRGGGGFF